MNKDVIYIDVEDDLTTIIEKVKSSDKKIIALIPPKRIGALQSAVNLRILAKASNQNSKKIVIVSGDQVLVNLAAAAHIPSARTLQSKPTLPDVSSLSSGLGDNTIDGTNLPVGELAVSTIPVEDGKLVGKTEDAVESIIKSNEVNDSLIDESALEQKPRKTKVKIPDFDSFRKKLFLGLTGVVLLVGALIWAIFFAPTATVEITARTIKSSANIKVTLVQDGKTDLDKSTLLSQVNTFKKDISIPFEATGKKKVGEKASGQVIFRNCTANTPQTIAVGTGVSVGGKTYLTQAAVTVPGAQGFITCTQPGVSSAVKIIAQDIGEDFNQDQNTYFSVADHPSLSPAFYFRAVASTDISGGSSKEVKVVSEDDVKKTTDQLSNQDVSSAKSQLVAKFGDGAVVAMDSFRIKSSDLKPIPAVDEEIQEGVKPNLSGTVTYEMVGSSKEEVDKFLTAYFDREVKKDKSQKIYDNGAKKSSFIDVMHTDQGGYTATLVATATFGPKIDEAELRQNVKGLRYSEVQALLDGVSGIEKVDTKFSPFWVRTVPHNDNRIKIEFKLNESG